MSDYGNRERVNWTINVAVIAACDVLVTTFFLLRIYVKCTIDPKILADDWTCAIAFILIVLYTVTVFMMAHYGEGYHAWDVPLPEYYHVLKWLYASTVVYYPAAFFIQASVLLLMARVFAVASKTLKGIGLFIWALTFAYIPIQVVQSAVCIPIQALWDPTVSDYYCLNQRMVTFCSLALSILTNLIILILPIPLIWTLCMPLSKKVKIVMLLSAGSAATALTIYRTYRTALFLESDDITVDYVVIDILMCLEISIGFICACLPSLDLLIERRSQGKKRRDPNRPQTRQVNNDTKKRYLHWGNTPRTTEPSSRYDSRPFQRDESLDQAINLDVELAMRTGRPVRLEPRQSDNQELLDARTLGHRIDYGKGQEEGWLISDDQSIERSQGTDFIMRMVERSKMLSEEGPKESWCPVWDGPREKTIRYKGG